MLFSSKPAFKHKVRNDWEFEIESEIPPTIALIKQLQYEGDIPDTATIFIPRRPGEPTYRVVFTTLDED